AWARQYPTYRQASPAVIGAALARSRQRPSGNWYTIAASSAITSKPFGVNVAGAELVCWRGTDGRVLIGSARCPHLGADLCTGSVDRGQLVCPW
ncbi:2Fe-2S ferredoxin, partial [Mycobacterium sp. ITM-2017-0098]